MLQRQEGDLHTIRHAGREVGMLRLSPDCLTPERMTLLWSFEIYPEFRGNGYGETALRTVIQSTTKIIRLKVEYDNATAINLYRKVGFRPTARNRTGVVTMRHLLSDQAYYAVRTCCPDCCENKINHKLTYFLEPCYVLKQDNNFCECRNCGWSGIRHSLKRK